MGDQSWSTSVVNSGENLHVASNHSFLFCVRCRADNYYGVGKGLVQFKLTGKYNQYALQNNAGPSFGGGNDLTLFDTKTGGLSGLGASYTCPQAGKVGQRGC